jgi:hypothetical protein
VLPFLFWVVRTFNPGEGYRKEQKPIPAYCLTIFFDESRKSYILFCHYLIRVS